MAEPITWNDQPTDTPGATQLYPLGTRRTDIDNKIEYEYVKANGTIAAGKAVATDVTDTTGGTIGTTTTAGRLPRGITHVAFTATTGIYGWITRRHLSISCTVKTGVSAGNALITTTTAGALGAGAADDAPLVEAIEANSSGSDASRLVGLHLG